MKEQSFLDYFEKYCLKCPKQKCDNCIHTAINEANNKK